MKHRLTFIAIYPFIILISILPFFFLYRLSEFFCFVIYKVLGYRKKIIRKNLDLAFPNKSSEERKKMEWKIYLNFCDVFLEMLKTVSVSQKQIDARLKLENLNVINQFKDKKSVILLCGHFANWEWLIFARKEVQFTNSIAVYTPLTNKYFNDFILKTRSKFNTLLISRYKLYSVLNQYKEDNNAVYTLIGDQLPQLRPNNYWRPFMGTTVPVFRGAERIAKKYDLPVIFAKTQRTKRGHYSISFSLISENPITEKEHKITDTFIDKLEAQIKEDPTQYLWTHDRFKHKRDT